MNGKLIPFFVYVLICAIVIVLTPADIWTHKDSFFAGSFLWFLLFGVGLALFAYGVRTVKQSKD